MRRFCVVLGALWLAVVSASATLFTDLYVFGDSLSDMGNLSVLTSGTQPGPSYYMGRFSDGPVAAEVYAGREELFGIGGLTLAPSLLGGNNYAVAAARTGSHPAGGAFSVSSQVAGYLAAATVADPGAQYMVWAGANDVRDALLDPPNASSILVGAIGNLQTVFTDLISAGAQSFLVPNVPDLGLIPEVTQLGDPAAVAGATFLSTQFNTALDGLLDGLNGLATFYRYDAFTRLNELVADGPTYYGLTNVTDPYLGSGTSDPDAYLFYDTIHPTAAVHRVLGLEFPPVVPEPGALALFVVGLLVVCAGRHSSGRNS